MSLNKKILGLLFLVLFSGVFISSYILIRASVEDKRNYIYDLQVSNAILINEMIEEINTGSRIVAEVPGKLRNFPGIEGMGVAIKDQETSGIVVLRDPEGMPFPKDIAKKISFNGLATSFHKDEFIVSIVSAKVDYYFDLIIVSKDKPIFNMLTVYFQRTLPVLFIVLLLSGIVGWTFSRKISHPLEALSESTKKIGEGKWDVKAPVSSTKEINQLSQAFQTMGEQLKNREQELIAKEKLSALGTFGAGIAHELKNPLNIISSYAQLIERANTDNDKLKKQSDVILSEVNRASTIINDLLSFARQKPLNIESFEAKSFLQDLFEKHKTSGPNHVTWTLQVEGGLQIKADQGNIRQVLSNLLENAVHVLEGVKEPTIRLNAYQEEDCCYIEVRDNGGGIPSDVLPHIFEPFYTTKTVGKGTGLGLAFCKGMALQHNGDLVVETSGEGTQFTLKLPV